MSKFITKTVNIIFWLFAACALICQAISGGSIIFGNSKVYLFAAALLVGCCLFLVFGNKILRFAQRRVFRPLERVSALKMAVIIGVVTFATKLFFVLLFQTDANLHPDMQRYYSFANQIAEDGAISEYVWYAYRHRRTAIYGLLLSPFAMLFGSSTQALTAGLTFGMAIASVLLFDIIRKYTGNPIAFVGVMVYNLMPFGLFQTQLLVHETPLLIFHILAFWLLQKALENKYARWLRVLCLLLSAVSIGLGKSVNPAGMVVIISMMIFVFLHIIKEKMTLKKLLRFVCVLLVFCIGVSAAQLALDSTIDPMIPEDEANREIVEKTVGYGWTIYLAFNYETNGGWNRQDYETYYAFEDIQDPEEAKQHQLELVKERLSQYVQEPLKIPVLMWNKFYALWGDLWLSFFYEQGNHIEGFVYKGAGGLIFVGIFLMTVMCNLMALTTALFSRKRKKENNSKTVLLPSIHFKMVVLGVTAALLFSEVMSKYSSHLVMLIYAVWMLELKDFADNSALVQQKITALLPGKQKRY